MENSKNVFVGIGFAIVVVGALFLWGKQTPKEPALLASVGASRLEAAHSSFDFGAISMRAGKVKHSFPVRNGSSTPVRVTKLYTSCMCTEAQLITANKKAGPFGMPGHGFIPGIDVSVSPGEEAAIEAIFDPAAHGPAGIGKIERVVYVETDSGAPVQFAFSAEVTP